MRVGIVQARMGSSRLPGKAMIEIAGKPMLWHVVDRLRHARQLDGIWVATTVLPEDDRIEEHCRRNSIPWYRGSSEDVLERYYEAALKAGAGIVVRITSDCPLIDPAVLDAMMAQFLAPMPEGNKADYMSNTLRRTFPRGLDVEIFTMQALSEAHHGARDAADREHVTPFIYRHPERYALANYVDAEDRSGYRWTVDTPQDLALIREIYGELYREHRLFLFSDVIALLRRRPELALINRDVQQKAT